MAARIARFRVGPQRITKGLDPARAGYAMQIRSQMKAVEQSYSRLIETLGLNSEAAIEAMLQPVFNRSQELVPVKTGALKSSGYIATRQSRGRSVGEVGYGKGNVPPYAVFVHENLDAQHAPPTQAKFLEQAVDEHAAGMLDQAAGVYAETLGL